MPTAQLSATILPPLTLDEPVPRWRRRRYQLGVAAAVTAAGALALVLHARAGSPAAAGTQSATAHYGELKVVVPETGVVAPLTRADIKSEVAGQVIAVLVQEGDRVHRGQPLLELDPTPFERTLAQARADRDYAQAHLDELIAGPLPPEVDRARTQVEADEARLFSLKADFERSQAALKDGTLSPREAEGAQSAYLAMAAQLQGDRDQLSLLQAGTRPEEIAQARAQLAKAQVAYQEAEDQLGYTTITAPFDGTVISRGVDVGEIVTPGVSSTADGKALLSIADLRRLVIDSEVNQVDVGKLVVGMPVGVRSDSAPGTDFPGRIYQLAPSGMPSKLNSNGNLQVFPMETVLDGHQALRPGMTADLDVVVSDRKRVLLLPVEAISSIQGDQGTVYMRGADGKAIPRQVTIGQTDDRDVEILKGLKAGDRVLITPASAKPDLDS